MTKATQSKVRNTKLSFKNGKNQQAEALLKQSFEPLFSPKDGKARLTFCGVEHSLLEWEENRQHKEAPVMKLVFSVLDITHEAPTTIALTCNYRLSERNLLGKVLKTMGYEFKKESTVIDEDDEFGVRTDIANPAEIFDFLRAQCGLVYKANLTVALRKDKTTGQKVERPGLWDIDASTLEPKMLKNGEQERDMMASDISDEDFQNPEIAMASEAQ
jgi:hypothetical protein